MRIKRFIAPDMRTALRMVRDEQGPDAVILSNRPTAGGIEIVAATDYDEALVQQALRAAAPGLGESVPVAVHAPAAVRPATASPPAARPAPQPAVAVNGPSRAEAMIAALAATPPRDGLAARARAVFGVGGAALSANESAPVRAAVAAAAPSTATPLARPTPALASLLTAHADASELSPDDFAAIARAAAAPAQSTPPPAGDDFRALLARLTADDGGGIVELSTQPAPVASVARVSAAHPGRDTTPATNAVSPTPGAASGLTGATDHATSAALHAEVPGARASEAVRPASTPVHDDEQRAAPRDGTRLQTDVAPASVSPATLRAVPAEDPALVAMRAELAMMRELIERQMDQYAIERLRGSAGRAWAFDTLVGYGCDEGLAQSIASRIDARLSPEEARAPMVAGFARSIVVNRAEPIDDGGVIALVGPTGSGKTTTIAKLAARFAARHRARDVALVTTDVERAGAREQLHAHGRRLGITVCEAEGPEGLNQTLDQLADYPLVLVDTAGYAARDRALLGQILWLRTARRVRSLLVLPANANPHDLAEVVRRYRPASPEGVVLTKTDETGRLGAALSVLVKHDLSLAYTTSGQQVPADIEIADPARLVATLETLRRAADNPLATEDRHAVA